MSPTMIATTSKEGKADDSASSASRPSTSGTISDGSTSSVPDDETAIGADDFVDSSDSRKLIYIAVAARHLENFRVKKVYDKRVINKMIGEFGWRSWSESEESRKSSEAMCDFYNTPQFWER